MFGFSSYFWLTTLLFTLNQVLEKYGVVIPYVHSYLDDVLCPGIVLGFALFVQQQLTYRNADYILSKGDIIFFVVWYSLLFEVIFPWFDQRHHSDLVDVLAYSIGALLFYKLGSKGTLRLFLWN